MMEAIPAPAAQKESLRNAFQKMFSDPENKDRFFTLASKIRDLQPKLDAAPPASWQRLLPSRSMPPESVRMLIESGFDFERATGPLGEAPLHRMALSPESEPAVREILAHGANPHLPRSDGKTPYVLAVRAGNTSVAALFEAHGAMRDSASPVDRLLGACVCAAGEEVRRTLEAFPDVVHQMSGDDHADFIKLAANPNAKISRAVAESGFDVKMAGADGATALHLAAWEGSVDTVQVLLDVHSTVNAVDLTFGSSPLTWAAHGSKHCRNADDDYAAIVKALLAAGAEWIDRWESLPDAIASPAIAALLKN